MKKSYDDFLVSLLAEHAGAIAKQLEISNKLKRMEILMLSAVYDKQISPEDLEKLNQAFNEITM